MLMITALKVTEGHTCEFKSTQQRPDRLWTLGNVLSNSSRVIFLQG
jgi:hypothetical protein